MCASCREGQPAEKERKGGREEGGKEEGGQQEPCPAAGAQVGGAEGAQVLLAWEMWSQRQSSTGERG